MFSEGGDKDVREQEDDRISLPTLAVTAPAAAPSIPNTSLDHVGSSVVSSSTNSNYTHLISQSQQQPQQQTLGFAPGHSSRATLDSIMTATTTATTTSYLLSSVSASGGGGGGTRNSSLRAMECASTQGLMNGRQLSIGSLGNNEAHSDEGRFDEEEEVRRGGGGGDGSGGSTLDTSAAGDAAMFRSLIKRKETMRCYSDGSSANNASNRPLHPHDKKDEAAHNLSASPIPDSLAFSSLSSQATAPVADTSEQHFSSSYRSRSGGRSANLGNCTGSSSPRITTSVSLTSSSSNNNKNDININIAIPHAQHVDGMELGGDEQQHQRMCLHTKGEDELAPLLAPRQTRMPLLSPDSDGSGDRAEMGDEAGEPHMAGHPNPTVQQQVKMSSVPTPAPLAAHIDPTVTYTAAGPSAATGITVKHDAMQKEKTLGAKVERTNGGDGDDNNGSKSSGGGQRKACDPPKRALCHSLTAQVLAVASSEAQDSTLQANRAEEEEAERASLALAACTPSTRVLSSNVVVAQEERLASPRTYSKIAERSDGGGAGGGSGSLAALSGMNSTLNTVGPTPVTTPTTTSTATNTTTNRSFFPSSSTLLPPALAAGDASSLTTTATTATSGTLTSSGSAESQMMMMRRSKKRPPSLFASPPPTANITPVLAPASCAFGGGGGAAAASTWGDFAGTPLTVGGSVMARRRTTGASSTQSMSRHYIGTTTASSSTGVGSTTSHAGSSTEGGGGTKPQFSLYAALFTGSESGTERGSTTRPPLPWQQVAGMGSGSHAVTPYSPNSTGSAFASATLVSSQHQQRQPLAFQNQCLLSQQQQQQQQPQRGVSHKRRRKGPLVRLSKDGKVLVAGVFRVSAAGCLTVRNFLLLNPRRIDAYDIGSSTPGGNYLFSPVPPIQRSPSRGPCGGPTAAGGGGVVGDELFRQDACTAAAVTSGSAPLLKPVLPRTLEASCEQISDMILPTTAGASAATAGPLLTPKTLLSVPGASATRLGTSVGGHNQGNASFTLLSTSMDTPYSPITYSLDSHQFPSTMGGPVFGGRGGGVRQGTLLRAARDEMLMVPTASASGIAPRASEPHAAMGKRLGGGGGAAGGGLMTTHPGMGGGGENLAGDGQTPQGTSGYQLQPQHFGVSTTSIGSPRMAAAATTAVGEGGVRHIASSDTLPRMAGTTCDAGLMASPNEHATGGEFATSSLLPYVDFPRKFIVADGACTPQLPSNAVYYRDLDVKVPVGEGASASVFVAIHRPTGRRLAVKRVDLSPLCLNMDVLYSGNSGGSVCVSTNGSTGGAGGVAVQSNLTEAAPPSSTQRQRYREQQYQRFLDSCDNGRVKQLQHIVIRELQVLHLTYRSPFMVKVYNAFYLSECAALDIVMEFMHYGSLDHLMTCLQIHAREEQQHLHYQHHHRHRTQSARTSRASGAMSPDGSPVSVAAIGALSPSSPQPSVDAYPVVEGSTQSMQQRGVGRATEQLTTSVMQLHDRQQQQLRPRFASLLERGSAAVSSVAARGPSLALSSVTLTQQQQQQEQLPYMNTAQTPLNETGGFFPHLDIDSRSSTFASKSYGGNSPGDDNYSLKSDVGTEDGGDQISERSDEDDEMENATTVEEPRGVAERVVAVVGEQLLRGVRDMHGRGYIHRDIKPGNVLVNEHGVVKLSDFGLSQRCDSTGTGIQNPLTAVTAAAPTICNTPVQSPVHSSLYAPNIGVHLRSASTNTKKQLRGYGGGSLSGTTGGATKSGSGSGFISSSTQQQLHSSPQATPPLAPQLAPSPIQQQQHQRRHSRRPIAEDLDVLDAGSSSSSDSGDDDVAGLADTSASEGTTGNKIAGASSGALPAAFAMASSSSSEDLQCSGTDKYMSPERQRGELHGKPSDIWAVGVTLAEFAVGEYPYDISTATDSFERMRILEQPVDLHRFNGINRRLVSLSPVFQDFIRLATLPVSSDRPTAQELLEHPFFRQWSTPFDLKGYLSCRVPVPSNVYKEEYRRERERIRFAEEEAATTAALAVSPASRLYELPAATEVPNLRVSGSRSGSLRTVEQRSLLQPGYTFTQNME